jgi:acetyl esterase/lipase
MGKYILHLQHFCLRGTPARVIQNVSYGIHSAQAMDIYLPPNRSVSSTKILVIIHGGGFNSGSKDELSTYIQPMQKRLADYAFFNITYRQATTNDTLFPAQENDVKKALEFIVNNSASFDVSKKMVLLGVSAGGTLALLQGYKYKEPVIPKAIIFIFWSNRSYGLI